MKKIKFVLAVVITAALFLSTSTTAFAAADPVVDTDGPIVLDSDRAVLLGASSAYSKVREKGFYYGLSPEALDTKIASKAVARDKMNVLVTGLAPETTYYYCAFVRTRAGIYKGNVCALTTPAAKEWTAEGAIFDNSDDRYNYIFGTTTKYYKMTSPPWGYNGSKEAAKHIVTVTVPVWKISKKVKVPSSLSLKIHYKLAAQVQAIFNEIYALDIQFPIKTVAGYGYRRMVVPWVRKNPYLSQHSFGTCIDINKANNLFYRVKDKRNASSPYYIPESVIAVFEKYGWTWGGDFKEGLDTMHFQYLGLELME